MLFYSLLSSWLNLLLLLPLCFPFSGARSGSSTLDEPSGPVIVSPAGFTFSEAHLEVFRQIFDGAVMLARSVVLYQDCDLKDDPVFTRYFLPTDATFVINVFRAIANIPILADLNDPPTLHNILASVGTFADGFKKMSVCFLGDNPGAETIAGGPGRNQEGCDWRGPEDEEATQAYIIQATNGNGWVSVCPEVYNEYPMLKHIVNPPDWAIDPDQDQTHGKAYYPGYGCANLLDFDSDFMMSPGSFVLHELIHFRQLFLQTVPNYSLTIWTNSRNPAGELLKNTIVDFPGAVPNDGNPADLPDGYGAWNAAQIRLLTPRGVANSRNPEMDYKPLYNVDNYVFLALSKYFQRICGRTFGPAPDSTAAENGRNSKAPPPLWWA